MGAFSKQPGLVDVSDSFFVLRRGLSLGFTVKFLKGSERGSENGVSREGL